jgi:ferric-dicitrate binding protein FerR (iron transport regulator)
VVKRWGSVAALVVRAVLGVRRCGLLFLFEAVGAMLLLLALLVVLAQVTLAAEATGVVRPRISVLADGSLLEVRALVVAIGAELARVDLSHLLAGKALPKKTCFDLP